MTDRGAANSTLLIGFHNWVMLGLSLRCKLCLVLKLSIERTFHVPKSERSDVIDFRCMKAGTDPGFWSGGPNGVLTPVGPEPKICSKQGCSLCLKTEWFWTKKILGAGAARATSPLDPLVETTRMVWWWVHRTTEPLPFQALLPSHSPHFNQLEATLLVWMPIGLPR